MLLGTAMVAATAAGLYDGAGHGRRRHVAQTATVRRPDPGRRAGFDRDYRVVPARCTSSAGRSTR